MSSVYTVRDATAVYTKNISEGGLRCTVQECISNPQWIPISAIIKAVEYNAVVAFPSCKGRVLMPLLFVKATSVTEWSLEFCMYVCRCYY